MVFNNFINISDKLMFHHVSYLYLAVIQVPQSLCLTLLPGLQWLCLVVQGQLYNCVQLYRLLDHHFRSRGVVTGVGIVMEKGELDS